jgi:2-polyprenyl-6-methoxyphenol hydroxylase-like FAD-dependent oxidoreductase
MRVIVVGSGIGGLSAAIALREVGFDVAVYERAPELREIGAGISLWANALRALDAIGAGDAVRAVSLPAVRSEMRASGGRKVLFGVPVSVFEKRFNVSPFLALTHRAELVGALSALLPPGVARYGHECTAVDVGEKGVRVTFANGHTDEADVLVGADGIHSAVRASLFGAEPPRYSGYTCWRGIGPRPAAIDPGYIGEWWGRGQRFGITTLTNDRTYWFAVKNAPAGGRAADESSAVREAFRDWAAPIPELLAATPPDRVFRNDIIDRPPAKVWSKGRAGLIGDAAHPTTPNFGQGGCMAIEDAVVLARSLKANPDPAAAWLAFAAERAKRTTAITRESWKFGKIAQAEGRVTCWLRDRLFGLLLPLVGARSLPKYAAFDVGPLPS